MYCCLLLHSAGRSILYKTDYEGNPLLDIGKYGRAPGEFNEPSGITKDGDDIILVADSRNDRIQVSIIIFLTIFSPTSIIIIIKWELKVKISRKNVTNVPP